ncbi:MAG: luciferase family protein [Chloroflexota bacterium]
MNDDLVATIERAVMYRPGFITGDTGRGGLQFLRQGGTRAPSGSRCADLPFTRKIRDELTAAGRATVYPPLPESGWVRRPMAGPADAADVIALFRLNYDRARTRDERMSEQQCAAGGRRLDSVHTPDDLVTAQ